MPHPSNSYFLPKWYDLFTNPFYLIRRGLYRGILNNRHYLHGKMLDFGCGNKPYASLLQVEQHVGLDYDTEVSRRNLKKTVDVFYDGKTIPFPDNEFDSAFSSEVLEHVFNPDVILPEILRVLKPGGHLLLTCPFFWPEHEQPYDYARYTSFALKHLMEKNGFEVVHYEKTGNFMACIIQSIVSYIYFFIPHRPYFLEVFFFTFLITPFLVLGKILMAILPKKMRRDDFYLNNIIVVKKPEEA